MTSERELKDYFGNQPINCGLQRKPDEWTDSWRRRSCVYITTLSPQTAFFLHFNTQFVLPLHNHYFLSCILYTRDVKHTACGPNPGHRLDNRLSGYWQGEQTEWHGFPMCSVQIYFHKHKQRVWLHTCVSSGLQSQHKKKKLHRRRSFCHQGKYLSKAIVHNKQSKIGRVDKSYWN